MKQKYSKTTKTTMTVTWDITVQDDDGRSVAYLTGLVDGNHPRGNISMVVRDQATYEANKSEVDNMYNAFVEEVNTEIAEKGDKLLKTALVESGSDMFSTMPQDDQTE